MKRLLFALLCLPVLASAADRALVPASPQDIYSVSAALVVGEYTYGAGWPALPGVKSDTAAVADALRSDGFTVQRLDNPTRQQLSAAVDSFLARYASDSRARVLIYFAGHGHTITKDGLKTGYIVLKDATDPSKDINGFLNGSLRMDYFADKAKSVKARHTLFVFDSCFSGSIFSAMRSIPDFMKRMLDEKAREFITSGTEDQQVPDVSIFRQRFIDGINGRADGNGDGLVTGSELGIFLQQQVDSYSSGTQTPVFGKMKDTDGEFVFFVKDKKQQKQAQMPMAAKPTPQKTGGTEKDRLLAVIMKNPESPDAYAAMKRLREIDPSLNNMPPVIAPERKDLIMTAGSTVNDYYNGPEYPYVIIAPVASSVNGRTLMTAFRVRASDGDAYRRLNKNADAIADAIGRSIEGAGMEGSGSVAAAREKIRRAAADSLNDVCPSCVDGQPEIVGIRIK